MSGTPETQPEKLMDLIRERGVRAVDLRYTSVDGRWRHVTVPAEAVSPESLRHGWQVDDADGGARPVRLLPDPDTALPDPFREYPTLGLICDVLDGPTGKPSELDARGTARRALERLRACGWADEVMLRAECDFYILDDVRYEAAGHRCAFQADSIEGVWNRDRAEQPNLGRKGGDARHMTPPADHYQDLRSEIMFSALDWSIPVVRHTHGAGPGQARFTLDGLPLLRLADALQQFKYLVKNIAFKYGKTATFMPRPLRGPASGLALEIELRRGAGNALGAKKVGGVNPRAPHFMGGIVRHAPALAAFATASENSYRRDDAGGAAQAGNGAASGSDAGAAPRLSGDGRIAFESSDGTANPYLLFAALLLAGLDGVEQKMNAGKAERAPAGGPKTGAHAQTNGQPDSLARALDALERDHGFLVRDKVFSRALLEEYARGKLVEVRTRMAQPDPLDYVFSYDC